MDTSAAFPPEMERKIFETAASLHPASELLATLPLVAHRVRLWIDPLLYRNLVVRNVIFWDHIRDDGQTPGIENFLPFLSICSGIRNLALSDLAASTVQELRDPTSEMAASLSTLQIEQLTLPFTVFISLPGHFLFTSITHLCLADYANLIFTDLFDLPLDACPSLTHLCVTGNTISVSADVLRTTLRDNRSLQLVVCMLADPGARDVAEYHDNLEISDPRFMLVVMNAAEYLEDWRAGAAGGRDFWVRAEEFVAKRRSSGEPQNLAMWYGDDDE
ncbi:hypothetical protein C8R43DRAFT_1116531 [Mycena crocata]|nr:hypothetical protein C8R43DRAFT_1116531 [Mycena crocata]